MDVTRIADGFWRWTGFHPEWKQVVGCLYVETDDAIVLVDPLVPPEAPKRFWKALERDVKRSGLPVHVLITVFWHARSAREIRDRLGARVWTTSRARRAIERRAPVTDTLPIGRELPGGFEAVPTARGADRAVAAGPPIARDGDVLLGASERRPRLGLCPAGWLPSGRTLDDLRASLAPLLDRRIERILVSHGQPVLARGRDALRRAIAPAP
ncbi:MAG: hypothetical protein U0166_14190 [Acidobacteriota bacterium]